MRGGRRGPEPRAPILASDKVSRRIEVDGRADRMRCGSIARPTTAPGARVLANTTIRVAQPTPEASPVHQALPQREEPLEARADGTIGSSSSRAASSALSGGTEASAVGHRHHDHRRLCPSLKDGGRTGRPGSVRAAPRPGACPHRAGRTSRRRVRRGDAGAGPQVRRVPWNLVSVPERTCARRSTASTPPRGRGCAPRTIRSPPSDRSMPCPCRCRQARSVRPSG